MSFPRYPAYKDSGVEWLGSVPTHWRVERLKHLATVFPSNVDKKSYDDEAPVRLCNYTDVYYNDEIREDMDLMTATATAEQIEKFSLRAGDTIITKDSETADDIAISAYVPIDLPGVVCGYHLTMVRPKPVANGRFLKRYFDSQVAKAQAAVSSNGLTRVGLGQYAIDNLHIATPPMEEQMNIGEFLDRETAKIDALVAEQEQLITLLKEKRQAVISHAVTKGLDPSVPMKDSGVEWLGDVPEHWAVVRVKHLVKTFEQGWSPQCENFPVESASDWGVLKVGCVNGGLFNPEENKALPADLTPLPELGISAGDLLISRANTRELVGSAAVALADHHNLMLCDKLYRLRLDPDLCLSPFLSLFLGTERARGQIELAATGASSSMLNISQSTILEMCLALPPIAEQQELLQRIEESVAQLDQLVKEAVLSIELLRERRSALISAAVTGQIDVRGLASVQEQAA